VSSQNQQRLLRPGGIPNVDAQVVGAAQPRQSNPRRPEYASRQSGPADTTADLAKPDKTNPSLTRNSGLDLILPAPTLATATDGEALDLIGILSAVQETAYYWNIDDDSIEWESNAAEVLGLNGFDGINTGTAFQMLIAPEHVGRRSSVIGDTTIEQSSSGVSFRLQYRFLPRGRRSKQSLWLEDHGRWWADSRGQPVRVRGIIRVINERYWEEQRLLYRSDHDELTGQLNRIRLTEALDTIVTRSEQSGVPCGFLMAAVNNLAVINETFGYDVGDEVIATTAQTIKKKLRGGDCIGRYSSNKFGIILHDCSPSAMRIASERFMSAVRETPIKTSACQVAAALSIGGVLIPDHATTVHQATSHALWALDRAKARRHDNYTPYEPNADKETTRRRNIFIADEVTAALDENRMLLVLQPMVNCQTRQPDLFECLLRIEQPDGSIYSAGEFIPVAEQLGMARLIDRRTQNLAIDILKRHRGVNLSLNVSGLTAGDHDWLIALHQLTGGDRQITERLWIEITETATVDDLDQTINFVDTLKELGCKVAIDDFGAGYTSFKNLKLLNVDMVKIDGSFVKNLVEDKTDQIFIRTMVELAQSFGMDTVAEWVTNEATATLLKEAGISHMQGFHFGEPERAADMLAKWGCGGAEAATARCIPA